MQKVKVSTVKRIKTYELTSIARKGVVRDVRKLLNNPVVQSSIIDALSAIFYDTVEPLYDDLSKLGVSYDLGDSKQIDLRDTEVHRIVRQEILKSAESLFKK